MPESASALVVVDIQNGFITPETQHVVPIIAQMAGAWLAQGRDVVITRYLNYDGSPFDRIMGWRRFMDSPEIDLVDELHAFARDATAVIDKLGHYTLFTDGGAALVQHHGWTDLYLCGIDTEVCVLKTAVDAFERGIRPWLVSDASASHAGTAAHEAGLLVAGQMIGRNQVVTRATIPDGG